MTIEELRKLKHADYLGDGVYVGVDEHRGVVLATCDGQYVNDVVVLEDVVLQAFDRWRDRAGK